MDEPKKLYKESHILSQKKKVIIILGKILPTSCVGVTQAC